MKCPLLLFHFADPKDIPADLLVLKFSGNRLWRSMKAISTRDRKSTFTAVYY